MKKVQSSFGAKFWAKIFLDPKYLVIILAPKLSFILFKKLRLVLLQEHFGKSSGTLFFRDW